MISSFSLSGQIYDYPKKHQFSYRDSVKLYQVLGIYMYKSSVVDIAKRLKPSSRNEYEITDLNNVYLKNNDCDVVRLEENSEWFDSGTFDSLLKASNFVKKKYE